MNLKIFIVQNSVWKLGRDDGKDTLSFQITIIANKIETSDMSS